MSVCDGWHCPICLGSFKCPVLASCCGQSFCRACLDEALRQSDACPMCRSPLLLGPFSVTSNRALEEALAALAIASQGRSRIKKQIATNSDDGAKTRSIIVVQNVDLEVPTPVPNFVETGNSLVSLIHEERTRFQWVNALRLWRIRDVTNCRRGAAGERRWGVSEQSAKLRQKLRQWHLWCRVNWTSLQCVFYVFLFFVLVLFLRVQEEDFAETTRYLRRPN